MKEGESENVLRAQERVRLVKVKARVMLLLGVRGCRGGHWISTHRCCPVEINKNEVFLIPSALSPKC